MKARDYMAAKGGRIKRTREPKWLVARHGSAKRQAADACERAIETRERRQGRAEIAEQLEDFGILPPVSTE